MKHERGTRIFNWISNIRSAAGRGTERDTDVLSTHVKNWRWGEFKHL